MLKIEFLVGPKEIKLANISDFRIGLKITNPAHGQVAVDISKSALWVNSKRSISWDLAVQNGTLINLKIASLHCEIVEWALGDALFETAGTYELQLVWESFSARQQVVVLNS